MLLKQDGRIVLQLISSTTTTEGRTHPWPHILGLAWIPALLLLNGTKKVTTLKQNINTLTLAATHQDSTTPEVSSVNYLWLLDNNCPSLPRLSLNLAWMVVSFCSSPAFTRWPKKSHFLFPSMLALDHYYRHNQLFKATPPSLWALFYALSVFSASLSPASLLALARPRALWLPAGGRRGQEMGCRCSRASTSFPYGRPRPIKEIRWSRGSSGVREPFVIRNRNRMQRDGGNRCFSADQGTFSCRPPLFSSPLLLTDA